MLKRLLPFYCSLLARSLRMKWSGAAIPEKAVVVFWHGKMFAGWYAMRKHAPVALVSKSKDGEFLASVLKRWGYKLSRGSSKKQGMEALQDAVRAMSVQSALVITPDGPRGPRHQFKRGAFLAAKELRIPVIFLDIRYSSFRAFKKSWDKFELPLPFSSVAIESIKLDIASFPETVEAQHAWLNELSERIEHAA